MYVKDINGDWCKVEESNLKGKQIDIEKSKEAIVAERAEKRKKIIDYVNALDNDELQILRSNLFDKMQVVRSFGGQEDRRSSNCPDCHCSEFTINYDDCSKGDA
jgi:hypothetical protein